MRITVKGAIFELPVFSDRDDLANSLATIFETISDASSVVGFGADPTGVKDSAPAFRAAIAALGTVNSSKGGLIEVPPGIYRIASTVSVKKSVHIQGAGHSTYTSVIKPDPGVTAFRFERYNTPRGTTDSGSADFSIVSQMGFYNAAHKVGIWAQNEAVVVGNVRKTGPAPGSGAALLGTGNITDTVPYAHYICTTAGTCSGSGNGPKSLGDDRILNYTGQTNNFVVGGQISGATSGAQGIVIKDTDNGTTGILRLTATAGTFINGENLTDGASTTYAHANGTDTAATTDELDGTALWQYYGPGSAIKTRCPITLRDVEIDNMSGCGITIAAGDIEIPGAFANANGWQLRNVNISTCDGHGLFVQGSDANGGLWVGGQCGSNGGPSSDESFTGPGFNVYDSSFLGNTYVGVEFYTSGGQGNAYCDVIGGGSVWLGCYQEGTAGGFNLMSGNNLILGGGMGVADIRDTIGGPTWSHSSAPTVGSGVANAIQTTIKTHNGLPWRSQVFIPKGVERQTGGNVYVQTHVGGGTTSVATPPTGSGSGIVDGTCTWDFVAVASANDGIVTLGARDPSDQYAELIQFGEEVGILPTYVRYLQSLSGYKKATVWQYGTSGPNLGVNTQYNGLGLMLANNKTTITGPSGEMKIPAGKAMFDQFWVGGCRIQFSTSASDPSYGTWNVGDRMYYSGAACTSGGFEGKVCTVAGTAHAYGGVRTATIVGTSATVTLSGAAMSTVIDQQELKVGDWITVAAGARRQIISVSSDGLTLTLGATLGAAAGAAVATSAPTFKTFGAIS